MSTQSLAPCRPRYSHAKGLLALVAAAGMALPVLAQDKGDPSGGRTRAQPEKPGGAPGIAQPMSPAGMAQPAPVPITPPGTGPAAKLPPAANKPAPGAPQTGPDEITMEAFPEAVDLRALVEWVAETLGINVSASDQLSGSVVINAPVTVKKDQLLNLLNSLLEQQGFAIYKDEQSGWYRVEKGADIPPTDDTTRLIPTQGIRPSSLGDPINQQLGKPGVQLRISYLDDLGVILFTDTPRRVDTLQRLVRDILDKSHGQTFIRFDLQHVAATIARQRVIELLGSASPGGGGGQAPTVQGPIQPPGMAPGGGTVGNMLGLESRLNIDPQGNALILRGYEEEGDRVAMALGVIDRPNLLEYKQYFAGTAAAQIADLAQRRGLGTVETIDSTPERTATPTAPAPPTQRGGNPVLNQGGSNQQPSTGGPVMIVDTARGVIIYYGTTSQQQQLAGLIKTLDTEREQVVIVAYKLKNVPSDDVADLLTAMISGQPGTGSSGTSPFLPGGGSGRGSRGGSRGGSSSGSNSQFGGGLGGLGNLGNQFGGGGGGSQRQQRNNPGGVGTTGSGTSPFGHGEVFVISDRGNNQVLIKAAAKQQDDFSKLISKIDQRRPQVYIEVQIVAVSATDDFRLSFEVQGINAGGKGGAVNTNFGVGTLSSTTGTGDAATTTSDFLMRKNIATNLSGITAAILKNDQVPIVLHALKRDADTRILSSPQLLVDDNETAEIVNLEEQPTTSSSQGTSTTINSFSGFESAGTRLEVTPSISEGGYMRLSYDVELSNFVGTGSNGIPPVRQTRNVNSDSVTIPGDTTIVVGGIKVDSKTSTIAKVPLLGDIPLVGILFRDTNKNSSNTRLYVFITPRIMRDPNFRDLMLLTRGPQAEAGISLDVPDLKPAAMEIIEPSATVGQPSRLPAGGTPAPQHRDANGGT